LPSALGSRAVAERDLGSWFHQLGIVATVSRGEDHAWPCFLGDERVRGHRRAVHEVPCPQVSFLVFDDEHTLAHQDEEVSCTDSAGREPRVARRNDAIVNPAFASYAVRSG
jgi:hypothetical protein